MTTAHDGERSCSTMTGHEMAIELIRAKWSLPILLALGERPIRRKHLKHKLCGINDDRLDSTLARHLQSGLVKQEWIPGPRLNEPGYARTPLGHSLLEALEPLAAWQREHLGELVEQRRLWEREHPASAG